MTYQLTRTALWFQDPQSRSIIKDAIINIVSKRQKKIKNNFEGLLNFDAIYLLSIKQCETEKLLWLVNSKMNRDQRKYGRANLKKDDEKLKAIAKSKPEIVEVLSPRIRRTQYKYDKSVANRCCYIKPNLKDVEQSVDNNSLDLHVRMLFSYS